MFKILKACEHGFSNDTWPLVTLTSSENYDSLRPLAGSGAQHLTYRLKELSKLSSSSQSN